MSTAQSPGGEHASPVRTRRVAHPWRVVAVATLVGLLLVASFVAGRFFRPPATEADASAVAASIDVWATAEERVVGDAASFAGTVAAGKTREVTVAADGPAVVLRQTAEVGETVRPGDAAGEVSGVTYLFLAEPLALYRDLTEGDRGEDVASLQRALRQAGRWTTTDGVFGPSTARALREQFRQIGAPLPKDGPVTVGWRQFIPLGEDGAVVASAAGYGTTLSDERPLLTLETSAPTVRFTADVAQAPTLAKGQEVQVGTASGTISGAIRSVGAFQAAEGAARAGHEVTVAYDSAADGAPPVGQSVTVTPAAEDAAAPSLAVPQTAVRADASGSYVLVQDPAGAAAPGRASPSAPAERRVPVTVERTGSGWAAVTGDLAAGDRVKVS